VIFKETKRYNYYILIDSYKKIKVEAI